MSELLWYVMAFLAVASVVIALFWVIDQFFDDFMGR